MSKIPTLEECEILPGSFIADRTVLVGKDNKGDEVVIASGLTDEDCLLVAHRCNTFEGLLEAVEWFVRVCDANGYCKSGKGSDEEPRLAKARAALVAAKGATP